MRKMLTCSILVFFIAFFTACDSGQILDDATSPGGSQTENSPSEAFTPPTIDVPLSFNATIEYGEPDLITDNTGPLWAYIRFPSAGFETDKVISDWAYSAYEKAYVEIAGQRESDPEAEGEINVQFDSYLVDSRYAGILENGMFMSSHLAHPISVVRTFNIDTSSGTFLENTDILDYSRLESVFSVLRDKITEEYSDVEDYLEEIDEQWLEHIVIGHDGVIVVLERGMFLPSYLGTVIIALPYEQLGTAYIAGTTPNLPTDPSAAPPTEPPTSPSPTPPPTSPTPPTSPSLTPPPTSPTPPPTSPTPPSASPTPPPASPTPTPTSPTPPPTSPTPPPASPTPLPTAPPIQSPAIPIIPIVPPQSGDIDPSKPMVALTFDDGPSRYTSHVLDILEKYNARATFCVIGNLVDARRDTVRRAYDLGCEIIGHSWDHRNLSKLSVEEIKTEINDTSAIIESVTGVSPRLFRPPYGAVSNTLKSVSAELGYAMINWNVDPMDWDTKNADKVYNAIMADTGNKAIVLSHDLYGSTADAMERVVPELISKGYQLVTVSELMYYSNKTLEAGVVYYSGR